ncbi:MAG TPA: hypothetical protein PK876_00185 [Elusimicrobiota bacterium]|nr:hypothetical protein [Elusimicrobiota bacterium]
MAFPPYSKKSAFGLLWLALSAASLGFYGKVVTSDLSRQGLHYDVALHGVRMMGPTLGDPSWEEREDEPRLTVGENSFPLMFNDYNGAVESYLGPLPALLIDGPTAFGLNAAGVVWGYVLLGMAGGAAYFFYGSIWAAPALWAALGTNPSFVAFSRIGIYAGTIHGALFATALCLLFLFWKREGSAWVLTGSAAAMGLALGSRTLMLWYAIAVLIMIAWTPDLRRKISETPRRTRAAALGALLSGPLLILTANIRGDWFTFRFFAQHLVTSREGISNAAYLRNLGERIREFISLWDATAWTNINHPNRLGPGLIALAVLWLIGLHGYGKLKKDGGSFQGLWPVGICLAVLMQSPFTPTFLDVHHLSALFVPAALIFIAPLFIPIPYRGKRYLRIIYGGIALCFMALNFQLFREFQPHRHIHGGEDTKWNVMADVVDYLQKNDVHSIGLGDTGLMDPFDYLSGRKIQAEEIFHAPYGDMTRAESEELLRRRLREEETGYYLFKHPSVRRLPYDTRFLEIVSGEGRRAEVIKLFVSPESKPVFVLYKVIPFRKEPAG